MKKILAILSVAGIMAILASCSKSGDVSTFEIRESLKSASKSYELKQPDGSTAYLTISTTMLWPEKFGDADLTALRDSLTGIYNTKNKHNIDDAMSAFIDNTSMIEGTKVKEVASVPPSTAETYSYDIRLDTRIIEQTSTLVTYETYAYSYTGGAHPNSATRPFTYDLSSGKVIDKAWIFGNNEATDTALLGIIKESLMNRLGQQEYNEIYSDDIFPITVSNSVYISEGNIVFHYNPYEIGPYSLGPIDIEVSPLQVEKYLTPEAKTLLIQN